MSLNLTSLGRQPFTAVMETFSYSFVCRASDSFDNLNSLESQGSTALGHIALCRNWLELMGKQTAFANIKVAGGVFGTVNGVAMSHFAAWDGVSWAPLGDCIRHKQGRRDAYHRVQGNALHTPEICLGRRGNEISN